MKRAQYKKIALVIAIVLALGYILFFTPLLEILDFEWLKENRQSLKNWVDDNYLVSTLAYIALYVVVVAFSLPGAAVMTLAGGFLYGYSGILFVNIGATVGATAIFFVTRYLLYDYFQAKFGNHLSKVNTELEENGWKYMLSSRLFPLLPFFVLNIVFGLSTVKWWQYIVTTSIGIIPGSIVFILAGNSLATISSLSDVFTPQIQFAFAVISIVAISPQIIRLIKNKKGAKMPQKS